MPSLEELTAQLAEAKREIENLNVTATEWRRKAQESEQKLVAVREGLRPVLEALE